MPLITRLGRLFRADLHAVLDQIEEPEALLRQAVREMEEALAQDEQRRKLLLHELSQLARRREELDSTDRTLAEQLDICFAAGKDDLARGLIRRQLEQQALGRQLSARRRQLQAETDKLQHKLDDNHKQLEGMRQKLELLVQQPGAEPASTNWPLDEVRIRDEEVEVAFLREQQRRAQP